MNAPLAAEPKEAQLARRLANFRRRLSSGTPAALAAAATEPLPTAARSLEHASRLADALDGQAVATPLGTVVRIENPSRPVAIDRAALACLPGQPPADVPLVCLDTETTGLATAAGTVAFLIGLGWWEGQQFRQLQLLLPDQPDEVALLDMLAASIPAHAWLVTYNGRAFDWPLLVARFRMYRRDAPPHAGHLDLLSTVRRLFRHRMADARLRTAETALLGMGRFEDIDGWEIPGRYLSVLRGGNPSLLRCVVEHNDNDVRSLARLLAHLADELGDEDRRREAADGDLLGLARAFGRERRAAEALAVLDLARTRGTNRGQATAARRPPAAPEPGWLVDRSDGIAAAIAELSAARQARVVSDQIARERARLLRQLGHLNQARGAWRELATRGGPLAAIAWVELAKVLEHVDRDLEGALDVVGRAETLVARSAMLGKPLPLLEADLARRRARLQRRLRSRTREHDPDAFETAVSRDARPISALTC